MRRLRFTAKALLPVLILTAMFFTSCTEDGGSDDPGITPPVDTDVTSFEFTISSTMIDDYFGKIDTLNIQMKALDDDGLGVENATADIEILEGPGEILFPSGDKTSVEGYVNAKYVLTVAATDTARISGRFGNLTAVTKNVAISAEDVRVSISASPAFADVDQGASGTSNLTIRVRDTQSVNVSGVPIKVELLSSEGVLTNPILDPTNDSFTSTITVDEVNETTICSIRAYIDVDIDLPEGDSFAGGKNSGKKRRTINASTLDDMVEVTFNPLSSQVDHISVTVTPNQIIAGAGVNETAEVSMVAANEDNNGVANLQLYARLRNLQDVPVEPSMSISVPALTDASGATSATITTNGAVGTWVLEVRTFQGNSAFWADTLTVVTGDAQNVTVTSDTSRISIYGTNGIETTTIRALVRDQNDQPVEDGKMVYFLARNYPREVNAGVVDSVLLKINDTNGLVNTGYPDPRYPNDLYLPLDSALTNNGEAFVSLTAGMRKGPVRIDVWTYDDDGVTKIESRYEGLMIVSGPPHFIEVDYNPTGDPQGSSVYNLEISARVQDERNNDVEDGYAVSFWAEPSVVHVWEIGTTGNTSPVTTIETPGVAYSALSYQSVQTNEEVTLYSSINRIDGTTETDFITLTLPIQGAQGTMFATPINWDYGENNGEDAAVQLRLEVRDQYGHLINNQMVLFGCSKGRIMTIDEDIGQEPEYYALTGPMDVTGQPDDDPEGVAYRYWIASINEAFPDPATPETNIQIVAEIVDTQDASVEPVTIYLIQ